LFNLIYLINFNENNVYLHYPNNGDKGNGDNHHGDGKHGAHYGSAPKDKGAWQAKTQAFNQWENWIKFGLSMITLQHTKNIAPGTTGKTSGSSSPMVPESPHGMRTII